MNIQFLEPFPLFCPQECQELIRAADQLQPGRTQNPDPDQRVRTNSIFWLALQPELKDRLWRLALSFRDRYPWTWFQEPVQISRYRPGEYYHWHRDSYGNESRSSTRAITLTCTLQPAPGAVFSVEDRDFDLAAGEAVIFDSHQLHCAQAPAAGERWAFTVWYMQPNPALQPEH
mgnify:CR=1 FL=1